MRPLRSAILLLFSLLVLPTEGAVAYTPPPMFRDKINLQAAASCKSCHVDITTQWERSSHSKADRSKNLLFGRMYFYSLKQTRGATMVACGPCHETATFVNQDWENLRDVSSEGVACVFCHAVDGPGQGTPGVSLDLGHYTGSIRTPQPTNSHQSKYAGFLATSDFCGSCHQYSNQYGVPISQTFAEWKRSKYPKLKMTCQTCHMPGGPGRNSSDGPVRPRVANHAFDHEALAEARPNAVLLKLRGARSGDSIRVFATVTNAGWGHSLPTGNDQKLALLRLRVKSAAGEILYENDPFSEWDVSVFGVVLADDLGNAPVDTWNARRIVSDRRIKAGQSAQVRYDAPLNGAKGKVVVEAQFTFRRARPDAVVNYGLPDTYETERVLAETTLSIP